MQSRRRSLLPRLFAVAIAIGLAVLGAALALRWYDGRFPPAYTDDAVGGDVIDLRALVYNDSTLTRRLQQGEFRVLGLADSFGFGPVKNHYTFYSVAGRALDDAVPPAHYRFVNLSEHGITFDHYVQRYRYWSSFIEHDGAVFTVYLGNDLLEEVLGLAPDDLALNQRVRELGVEIEAGRGAAEADPYQPFAQQLSAEAYREATLAELANFEVERLPAMRPGYRSMIEFVRFVSSVGRSGVAVAIVLAPSESQVSPRLRAELARDDGVDLGRLDFALPGRLLVEAARRIDPRLPVLDLSGAMEAASESGTDLYYGTNMHWSVAGHQLAGTCVAAFLAERWFGTQLPPATASLDLCGRSYDPSTASGTRRQTSTAEVEDFLGPLLEDLPAR